MQPAVRAGDQALGEPTLGPLQHAAYVRPRLGDLAPSGLWSHQCAQGIRHSGSQPWGPCGTTPLFACAQGIQHPVGHRWGP